MTSGLSEFNQPPSTTELAAPEFFYSNLRIQETLANIRYGIEARKGLTILTGAAGTGKTTLLHKAAAELGGTVTCVFQSDPRVSFMDVLRLLLRHLDVDQPEEDESALVRNCRLQLRSRLEKCQVVALFLDNADQLPDHTIRNIAQSFLAGSAEDAEGTLLQVVLAGRPELKRKLAASALTALKRLRPITCELQPLKSGEIAPFITDGLKSINQPQDIFDERVIKRIGLYANGNPGAVRAICQRALQLAAEANETITTETIESAAAELDLEKFTEPPESENFAAPDEAHRRETEKPLETSPAGYYKDGSKKQPVEFKKNVAAAGSGFAKREEFPAAARFGNKREQNSAQWAAPKKNRATTWVQRVTILIIIAGAAAAVGKDTAYQAASRWTAALAQIVTPSSNTGTSANSLTDEKASSPTDDKKLNEPLVPVPGPDRPAQTEETPPAPRSDPKARVRPESLPANGRNRPTANSTPRDAPPPHSSERNENLQHQVAKAIESRAIMGVEVSVVQGTAFLDGRVASERQRRAAERAARSVAGVERVRNRIAITWG